MPTLVTRDYVKTSLAIETDGRDAVIDLLLDAVTKRATEEMGREIFEAVDDLRFVSGHSTALLILPGLPITSVSEIHVSVDLPRVYDATTLLDSDSYVVDTRRGLVERVDGGVWPSGLNSVRVKYTHGYATVPEDLQRAALELIAPKLAKGVAQNYHQSAEKHGEGQIDIRSDDLTPDARRVFARYREDLV